MIDVPSPRSGPGSRRIASLIFVACGIGGAPRLSLHSPNPAVTQAKDFYGTRTWPHNHVSAEKRDRFNQGPLQGPMKRGAATARARTEKPTWSIIMDVLPGTN